MNPLTAPSRRVWHFYSRLIEARTGSAPRLTREDAQAIERFLLFSDNDVADVQARVERVVGASKKVPAGLMAVFDADYAREMRGARRERVA